jgi:hypothetical protein
MLFEQALIQAKVPFDIIFDDQLNDLSRYRVLVLADQECLSEDQLNLIRNFVNQGGGLVATEHSSLYTEWRQRRRDFGLKDLLKVEAPPWRGTRVPEMILNVPPVRNKVGEGRVVYLSSVKAAAPKPPRVPMTSEHWKLPVNWQELIDSTRWAAGGNFSIDVKAPLTVTAELIDQKEEGRLLVHLLNYDVARSPAVSRIEVSLQIPDGKKVEQVSLFSPDSEKVDTITSAVRNERTVFTIPRLETYSVAVVRLR